MPRNKNKLSGSDGGVEYNATLGSPNMERYGRRDLQEVQVVLHYPSRDYMPGGSLYRSGKSGVWPDGQRKVDVIQQPGYDEGYVAGPEFEADDLLGAASGMANVGQSVVDVLNLTDADETNENMTDEGAANADSNGGETSESETDDNGREPAEPIIEATLRTIEPRVDRPSAERRVVGPKTTKSEDVRTKQEIRAAKRRERQLEKYRNSSKAEVDRATWNEKRKLEDWYETLKKATDANDPLAFKAGEWMSHEEKVAEGMIDDYKGVTPRPVEQSVTASEQETTTEQASSTESEQVKPAEKLYEVQHYELTTPRDVWNYTMAAAELIQYAKYTMAGPENLELAEKGRDDDWDYKRSVLIAEHWKWVRNVLADPKRWDEQEYRRTQAVYVDYIDWMHDLGEKATVLEYLNKTVPECKIDPTRMNLATMQVDGDTAREDLREWKTVSDEQYFSDEELEAIMKIYERSIGKVEHEVKAKQLTQKLAASGRSGVLRKIINAVMHKQGVQPEVADAENGESAEIIDLAAARMAPENEDVETVETPSDVSEDGALVGKENEDIEDVDTPKHRLTEIEHRGDTISLEFLQPDEDGIRQLENLADYCREMYQAALESNDDARASDIERWRENCRITMNNVDYAVALHESKYSKDENRENIVSDVARKYNRNHIGQILEIWFNNSTLDREKPLAPQLDELRTQYRADLTNAIDSNDQTAEKKAKDALDRVNLIYLLLNKHGDFTGAEEADVGETDDNNNEETATA